MANERKCTAVIKAGRLAKAQQFLLSAQTIATIIDDQTIADAYVTLCVHAGIAAADAICCARLGVHNNSENHGVAVSLLRKVDDKLARDLEVLLKMKTRSGYGSVLTVATDQKRAGRAATSLVRAATITPP